MNDHTQGNDSHGGVGHWWQQRLSSLVLIPMTIWLLWAGISLTGASYETALYFFSNPFQKFMAILFIAISAFHAQIGIQVICEDYIYPLWLQNTLIWLTRIACLVGFALAAYALLSLSTGA